MANALPQLPIRTCRFPPTADPAMEQLKGEVKQRQHSEILLYEGRKRLQLLLEIANLAESTDDLNDLLDSIAQRVVEIIPAADLGAIYTYDPAADELVSKACVGFDRASYEKIRLEPGESIAGKVFQTGQTFRARSREESAAYRGQLREQNENHFRQARSQRDVISNVATPLKSSDGVTIGVLTFRSTHAQCSQDDQSLLEGLAAQVAVSIQKSDAFEQARSRADELERRNEELGRFTYTVSHDLKSPLITIKGFLGLLKKDVLAGQFDSHVARMSGATDQMAQLLDELLQLSRIGRIKNPSESITLEPLVRDVVSQLEDRIQERGVEVVVSSDLPIVNADRVRLREVFQNLIENAVRFMGDQPEPRIEIGWQDAQPAGNENSPAPSSLTPPLLYVRDNGIGIPAACHEKVFGLFEQLNPSPELGGTGVGLAIVRRIIEVHNGHIHVESKGLGEGAAFCFTLGEESIS
jgi:signal transduction histidine kinase